MADALRWGVKQSLREYIRSNGGSIEVGGGALLDGDDVVFPADAAIPGGYTGFVRFQAHGGMMDWRLAAPRLEDDGTRLTLERRNGSRVVFAALADGEVRLAVDGALLLEGFYPVGSLFDSPTVV
jgi:hypothetical protein